MVGSEPSAVVGFGRDDTALNQPLRRLPDVIGRQVSMGIAMVFDLERIPVAGEGNERIGLYVSGGAEIFHHWGMANEVDAAIRSFENYLRGAGQIVVNVSENSALKGIDVACSCDLRW